MCDARFLDLGWAQCDLQRGAPSLGMARGFDVDELGNEAISDAMWQALDSSSSWVVDSEIESRSQWVLPCERGSVGRGHRNSGRNCWEYCTPRRRRRLALS